MQSDTWLASTWRTGKTINSDFLAVFLGGVWRRLWPTAIPRYKVLALRPPVVCTCECVCVRESVFGVSLLAKVSIANCSSTEPCNFRTTETNAGRQRQRDMLLPLSLPLPHSTRVHFSLPTLHEALSCQMCLLFQKGLLHPSEVYAPEIFPVFWWGKSRVAGYFMRPL